MVILLLLSCSGLLEQEPQAAIYYKPSPRVVISFATSNKTNARIVYWPVGKKSNNSDTSIVSINSNRHEIVLWGLRENLTYQYEIIFDNKNKLQKSSTFLFRVDSFSASLPHIELVVKKEYPDLGYLFLRKKENPGAQIILNSNGEVIWYQLSDTALFRPYSISGTNRYIALQNNREIVEVTFTGDTLLWLKDSDFSFDQNMHHEIVRDTPEKILVLTKEEKEYDFTAYGGKGKDIVVGDGIAIINNKGGLLWHWSIFDYSAPKPSQTLFARRRDWSHANAVCRDADGHFLISFKNFNQIWKVNSKTGAIIWRLGDKGDFPLHADDLFSGQHAVHINKNGHIMFFDNAMNPHHRGRKGKRSRALAFDIDEQNMVAIKSLDVRLPDSLYSFKQGSVYFIDDEHLLFCSSMAKKLAITDLQGNIVWQANTSTAFYRALYLPDLPWRSAPGEQP